MDRLETKAAFQINDAGEITGTAWHFGSPDLVGDVIPKSAFSDALHEPLPMLFGHNRNDPVGAWDSVQASDEAFIVKGRLLVGKLTRADEMAALIEAKALTGLSIGFNIKSSALRKSAGRTIGRTISALDLMEISLVTYPAHPRARIAGAKDAANALALVELLNRAAARFI